MPKQSIVMVRQILDAGQSSLPLFIALLKDGHKIQGVNDENREKVTKWLTDNKVGLKLEDLIAVMQSRSAFDTSALDKALQTKVETLTNLRDEINKGLEAKYGKAVGYRLHTYFHDDTKKKESAPEPKAQKGKSK